MKRFALVLGLYLFLVGCTAPDEVTVEVDVVPSETSVPTEVPVTATDVPDFIPTKNRDFGWDEAIEVLAEFKGSAPLWNPTSNELLYTTCWFENEGDFYLRVAPEFEEEQIIPCSVNSPVFNYSPDGEMIVFGGAFPEQTEFVNWHQDLWVMENDGSNSHRVFEEGFPSGSYLDIDYWSGTHDLVAISYAGGGHQFVHIIDVNEGGYISGAYFYGDIFPPNKNYLPAVMGYPLELFVVAKEIQERPALSATMKNYGSSDYMRAYPLFEELGFDDLSPYTAVFMDWHPFEDKMLVLEVDHGNDERTQLVEWNLDTNERVLLVYDVTWGGYSTNGEMLFYYSEDEKLVGVSFADLGNVLFVAEVQGKNDNDLFYLIFEPNHRPIRYFSPNGRYLLFSGYEILGKVINHDEEEFRENVLNVYDLDNSQYLLSLVDVRFISWSTSGAQFAIIDGEGLYVYDFSEGKLIFVSRIKLQEKLTNVTWSYDDRYIVVKTTNTFNHETINYIIETP